MTKKGKLKEKQGELTNIGTPSDMATLVRETEQSGSKDIGLLRDATGRISSTPEE